MGLYYIPHFKKLHVITNFFPSPSPSPSNISAKRLGRLNNASMNIKWPSRQRTPHRVQLSADIFGNSRKLAETTPSSGPSRAGPTLTNQVQRDVRSVSRRKQPSA